MKGKKGIYALRTVGGGASSIAPTAIVIASTLFDLPRPGKEHSKTKLAKSSYLIPRRRVVGPCLKVNGPISFGTEWLFLDACAKPRAN